MNIKELCKYFQYVHPIHHTLVIQANHGVGKSEVVRVDFRQIVADMHGVDVSEVGMIDKRAALMEPSDLIGNVYTIGGRTFNAPPAWLPIHEESAKKISSFLAQGGIEFHHFVKEKYGILFLDEVNRAQPYTKAGLFELKLDRSVFGVKIPDTWYIVCAENANPNLYDISETEPADKDREVVIPFEPTYQELFEHFQKAEVLGRIHPAIQAYLRLRTDDIDPDVKDIEKAMADHTTTHSRRSWYRLGEALVKLESNLGSIVNLVGTSEGHDLLFGAAKGYLGTVMALRFVEFVKESYSALSPEEIINNWSAPLAERIKAMADTDRPDGGNVPALAGLQDAVVKELAKSKDKKLTSKQAKNVLSFLECLSRELVSAFWMGWSKEANTQAVSWHSTPKRQNLITSSICPALAYDKWYAEASKTMDMTSDEPVPAKK